MMNKVGKRKKSVLLVSKDTILFGDKRNTKLQNAHLAHDLVSYIVAANLKFNDKTGKSSYDKASYGEIHKNKIVIDTSDSPVLSQLQFLLRFLYGLYINDMSKVLPNLSFRKLTTQERNQLTPFTLNLRRQTDDIQCKLIINNKDLWPKLIDTSSTVCIFAAARMKSPVSHTVGKILGQAKQTVIVGGPGAIPGNCMVNTAEVAKSFGSTIGFLSAEFLFQRQGSLHAQPDFVIVARTIFERACLMYESGHLLIALPGGVAVVEEVITAIICNLNRKLGKKERKTILLINNNGHWNSFYSWLKALELDDEVILLDDEARLSFYL